MRRETQEAEAKRITKEISEKGFHIETKETTLETQHANTKPRQRTKT